MWLYYSLPKLSYSSDALGLAVRDYQILPAGLADAFGTVQPFLELALGLLVLAGLGTRFAAACSALLLLVYIGSIASVWARGISIDCGCFGGGGAVSASKTAYLQEISRDIGFLLLAGWLVRWPRTWVSLDGLLATD